MIAMYVALFIEEGNIAMFQKILNTGSNSGTTIMFPVLAYCVWKLVIVAFPNSKLTGTG